MTPLLLTLAIAAAPEALVEVTTIVPDAVVDLRYATPDNFMKKAVYPPNARCLLLERSARQLKAAADVLREKGFRLRLYDCYRPHHVQFELWKVMPVPGYVAEPVKGSNHNRGGAVDLGLVTLEGKDVEFPSPYDFFGKQAHHGFADATKAAIEHRELLRTTMEGVGFKKNQMEWWHYDLPDAAKYPLRDEPFSSPGEPLSPEPKPGVQPDAGR